MNLSISGDLAKHILGMTKKDSYLAEALAHQFLRTIEPAAMASYLLKRDVALSLLTERIRKNPEMTLQELQSMPEGDGMRAQSRGAGRPVRSKRGKKAQDAKGATERPLRRRRKRQRLTPKKVELIKAAVTKFLSHHPRSTRKQICADVDFPSLAIYNRIMGELKDSGEIISQGQKAKTVYALKGSGKNKVKRAEAAPKKSRSKHKTRARATVRGKGKGKGNGKAKGMGKGTAKKSKTAPKKKAMVKREPLLCPFPECKNRGAPVFGMMCKDHKDVPKEERVRLFAERRQSQETPA
jgi:hypothetical protein